MNAFTFHAATLLLLAAAPVAAQQANATLPAVQVHATRHTIDCDARSLPSQRLIGELTGQHNFAQVYATRTRLMAEVSRACLKPGIDQVSLVLERSPMSNDASGSWVTRIEPTGR